MAMGHLVWIFALPVVSLAQQTGSEVDALHQTVEDDKQNLETAIHDIQNVATKFRQAAHNDTHAKALAKNLVEKVRSDAAESAKSGQKAAMNDFMISLSELKGLQTSNSSKVKDAANDAKQKSQHLDRLQAEEQKDAVDRLRKKRDAQREEVRQSYGQAHEAVRKLLKDRNRLENAQRHAGEKESVYEREEGMNEHFAERRQDLAEHQHEQALSAIEHIFEHAQDDLMDQGQKDRETAFHARGQAIHKAMQASLAQATQETAMPATINLMEDPMQMATKSQSGETQLGSLAAALKSMESSANQNKQSAMESRAHYEHQAETAKSERKTVTKTATEQQAQNLVDSDRNTLESAMKSMEQTSSLITNAVRNRTHANALVISLAEDAQSKAHDDMKDRKTAMIHDFENSVSALKQASSTSDVEHLQKIARQKAENVKKVQEEEDRAAKERLQRKSKAQHDEVRRSYNEAHEASRNMLKDRYTLERAQRRSGEKERVYEGDEMRNERFAEKMGDTAEDRQEKADDAISDVYERAQDHLQRSTQKNSEAAEHERQRTIESAVATVQTSLVASDKQKLQAAKKNMGMVASDFTNAAQSRTSATSFALNLAEKAQNQAVSDASDAQQKAVSDFTTALTALKSAQPASNWKQNEKAAREKSDNVDRVAREAENDAQEKIRSQRREKADEVRNSYLKVREAARSMLEDNARLHRATHLAGEQDKQSEEEYHANRQFAKQNRDFAHHQKSRADDAIELIMESADDHLHELQRQHRRQRQNALHLRHQAVEQAVATLRQQEQELLARPANSMMPVVSLCLVAAASLGLLSLFVARKTRPLPIGQPLLGGL